MSKYLLIFAINILLVNNAISHTERSDTTLIYFKYSGNMGVMVHSLDSADYFMLVLPPDQGDKKYNIQEYYKNGKIKFLGKADPQNYNPKTGHVILDGDCISYYPNGKRSSTVHYNSGYKDGPEYLYYPSGNIYCFKKNSFTWGAIGSETLDWECYDKNGKEICMDGNGHWLNYDDSCKNIQMEGQVVKGYMEGEWRGNVSEPDTIRYVYNYRKGIVQSSISYDRFGKAYPFLRDLEYAMDKDGPYRFEEKLCNRINMPNSVGGTALNNLFISFVVEKNGALSTFEISEETEPELRGAVLNSLKTFSKWRPAKCYGITYRSRLTLPLKEIVEYYRNYSHNIQWHQTIIADRDNSQTSK